MSVFKNELSLDDLIAEADEQFPNLTVDGVVFLNPLQMGKVQREAFRLAAESDQGDDDEDVEESYGFIRSVLTVAAADEVKAGELFDRIGDNGAVLSALSKRYFELNQVGEA